MSTVGNIQSAFSQFTRREAKTLVSWGDGGVEWTNGWLYITIQCLVLNISITFWIVNGITDFGIGFLTGGLALDSSLLIRIGAYLLLPVAYLVTKFFLYSLRYPNAVLGGRCPALRTRLLGLDWFAGAILMTTLPKSAKFAGAILTSLGVAGLGIFVLPRLFNDEKSKQVLKNGAIIAMTVVNFVLVHFDVPSALEPFAFTLSDATVAQLQGLFMNPLIGGLVLIPVVSMVFNLVMDQRSIREIYLVQLTNPDREPFVVVYLSSVLGAFYFFGIQQFLETHLTEILNVIP